MYKHGFCANVVHDGKILDDENGTVALPFGVEYKLRLKNKNTRDAVAKVYIDGRNATVSGDLIIHSNETVELERFIENLSNGNRFKFVSLDEVAPAERGNPQNGIVEVKFRLKKEPTERIIYYQPQQIHHYHYPRWYTTDAVMDVSLGSCTTKSCGDVNFTNCSANTINCCSMDISDVDTGKTVEGSHSSQSFSYSYFGELEDKETVVRLKIVGYLPTKVLRPKADSKYCTKCGSTVDKEDNFCSNCGNKSK